MHAAQLGSRWTTMWSAPWRIRQSIPEPLTHLKPTINFDVGLPWSQTTAFIERVDAALSERYPQAQHLCSRP